MGKFLDDMMASTLSVRKLKGRLRIHFVYDKCLSILVPKSYRVKICALIHCSAMLGNFHILFTDLFFSLIYYYYYFTLWYCIGFAIHQHASATGVHMFPILNPPPASLPITSLWVIPVHQPLASCILHRTWTGDSFLIWYCTCFNAILPNHPPPPSPMESKRLFYISVSLLLSRIQGCSYHLSKFHIYALVYCIGVFLSGLLHCA